MRPDRIIFDKMCLDAIRSPVSALVGAKKKDMKKTWMVLAEGSAFFGFAAMFVFIMRNQSWLPAVASALTVFLTVFVIAIVLGYMLKIIATTLGGKGGFYHGVTCIAYPLAPMGLAMLVAAVASPFPGGVVVSSLALAIGFSMGISMLYRAVRELFAVDMVTSLVALSILIIVLFIASSVSTGLSTIANLGSLVI